MSSFSSFVSLISHLMERSSIGSHGSCAIMTVNGTILLFPSCSNHPRTDPLFLREHWKVFTFASDWLRTVNSPCLSNVISSSRLLALGLKVTLGSKSISWAASVVTATTRKISKEVQTAITPGHKPYGIRLRSEEMSNTILDKIQLELELSYLACSMCEQLVARYQESGKIIALNTL